MNYAGLLDLTAFLAGDLSCVEQWRGRELQAAVRLTRYVNAGIQLRPRQTAYWNEALALAMHQCRMQFFPFIRRVMPGKPHDAVTEYAEALSTEYLMHLTARHNFALIPNPAPAAWARLYLRRDTEVERLSGLEGDFRGGRDRLIRAVMKADDLKKAEIGQEINALRFMESLDHEVGDVGDGPTSAQWSQEDVQPAKEKESCAVLLQSLQELMNWSKSGAALELLAAASQESRIFGPYVGRPDQTRVARKKLQAAIEVVS
ncbi:hypothetical protein [Candidatus Igneacidithiobacillus taiwanensis]|uniref:hypothetical protein n=1 Tax=Candidatus Igneacidithiobacillus taiwanensis TaxID=1945924 RepID=UPI002897F80E|nr:hypothetical protein [Candidatus Igneacidithiobacillus taiwanensis]